MDNELNSVTSYKDLYKLVLPKFKSYSLPQMTLEEVEELLQDYLIPAIVRFHVCRKNLSDRNEDSKCFNIKLSDTEIEILSNFLVLEYIDSNYIRVPAVMKPILSSSDFNAFSQANHLDKLMSMHDNFLSENETLLSRYAWQGKAEELAKKKKA